MIVTDITTKRVFVTCDCTNDFSYPMSGNSVVKCPVCLRSQKTETKAGVVKFVGKVKKVHRPRGYGVEL